MNPLAALRSRCGTSFAKRVGVVLKLLVLSLGITACSQTPPPAYTSDASLPLAVTSDETETLSAAQIDQVIAVPGDSEYRIGAGDVITVSVYLHPDLDVPSASNNSSGGGALVTGSGMVELPLIGSVQLAGLTLAEASAAITTAYGGYIRNPHVSIQFVQAQSLRYYLLGAFTSPGVKYPGQMLTLLEALALGGSVDLPHADLYQAYVARGTVKLPVDLRALLVDGDLSQNITLAGGDTIVVPSSASENAFVFGAVGKPGAVPFQSGQLSLLQALSVADLDLANYTDAELSQLRIIRGEGTRAQFIIVDGRKILDGQAMPFDLRPGDIIYVPPNRLASWNQVFEQLLPALQTIAGVLDPFVSIKFLAQ